jgi:hypothetical protein
MSTGNHANSVVKIGRQHGPYRTNVPVRMLVQSSRETLRGSRMSLGVPGAPRPSAKRRIASRASAAEPGAIGWGQGGRNIPWGPRFPRTASKWVLRPAGCTKRVRPRLLSLPRLAPAKEPWPLQQPVPRFRAVRKSAVTRGIFFFRAQPLSVATSVDDSNPGSGRFPRARQ